MTSNSTIIAKQKITKLIGILLFAEVALLLFVQARTGLYNVRSPNTSLRNSYELSPGVRDSLDQWKIFQLT